MIERMKGKEERDRDSAREGLIEKGGARGGWPTQQSQWMWQPSVDLLT